MSIGVGSSGAFWGNDPAGIDFEIWLRETLTLALFANRLLYAGQPLHPSAPPVPLQRPPPGQVPADIWSAVTKVAPAVLPRGCPQALGDVVSGFDFRPLASAFGGRFRVVGREVFLAFWYRPQALQMVAP